MISGVPNIRHYSTRPAETLNAASREKSLTLAMHAVLGLAVVRSNRYPVFGRGDRLGIKNESHPVHLHLQNRLLSGFANQDALPIIRETSTLASTV